MSNTNDELRELATIYRQLLDFLPYQRLITEMEKKVEEMKESNISNDDNDLKGKGIVFGIRYVLTEPKSVVTQFDDSLTRK